MTPKEVRRDSLLACSICRVKLSLGKATVGMFDADNRQAFACVSHFSEVELLIVGWADFMTAQRRELEHRKMLGVGNAWLNP